MSLKKFATPEFESIVNLNRCQTEEIQSVTSESLRALLI